MSHLNRPKNILPTALLKRKIKLMPMYPKTLHAVLRMTNYVLLSASTATLELSRELLNSFFYLFRGTLSTNVTIVQQSRRTRLFFNICFERNFSLHLSKCICFERSVCLRGLIIWMNVCRLYPINIDGIPTTLQSTDCNSR